jgi:hypothetical protein
MRETLDAAVASTHSRGRSKSGAGDEYQPVRADASRSRNTQLVTFLVNHTVFQFESVVLERGKKGRKGGEEGGG